MDQEDDGFGDLPLYELKYSQEFARYRSGIVTEQERQIPPLPNAHILLRDDQTDPVEGQIRKEFRQLRLDNAKHFHTKFALMPAMKTKVVMLRNGFSRPKFFKIFPEFDNPHLLPFRLYSKGGVKTVQVKFDCKWQSLATFIDTLSHESTIDYEMMNKYWEHTQKVGNKSFPLFKAPIELRRTIYRYAMFNSAAGFNVFPSKKWHKKVQKFTLPGLQNPPLLNRYSINKALLDSHPKIKEEALEEYYRAASFNFMYSSDLTEFTKAVKPQRFPIRQVLLKFTFSEHEWLLKNTNGLVNGGKRRDRTGLLGLQELGELSICIDYDGDETYKSHWEAKFESETASTAWIVAGYTALVAKFNGCQLCVV